MHLRDRACGFLASHPTLLLIERPTQLYLYLRYPIYRRWFWANVNEAMRRAENLSPEELKALNEQVRRRPLVPRDEVRS
jgi:hypothetical protein